MSDHCGNSQATSRLRPSETQRTTLARWLRRMRWASALALVWASLGVESSFAAPAGEPEAQSNVSNQGHGDAGPGRQDRGPSSPRRGRIDTVVHLPSKMVVVNAGSFHMGISEDELDELLVACQSELGVAGHSCADDVNRSSHQREVELDRYEIDRHEITAREYRSCVAAGACSVAALVAGDERYVRDDWPMVNVTWQDAADYCGWVDKRLPTEAEWEKAARGTDGRRFPWGQSERSGSMNHGRSQSDAMLETHRQQIGPGQSQIVPDYAPDDQDGVLYLAAPGTLRWGDSPYGAYDMAGNVAEWVADYFSNEAYDGLPSYNPVRDVSDSESLDSRVLRGGSWMAPKFMARTYYRRGANPKHRRPWVGFRCARTLD